MTLFGLALIIVFVLGCFAVVAALWMEKHLPYYGDEILGLTGIVAIALALGTFIGLSLGTIIFDWWF